MKSAATASEYRPSAPGAGIEVLVARQPIFDRDQRVAAYELLYRAQRDGGAEFDDGDRATASVITTSFIDIGIERMVENRPAFINVTRDFMLSGAPLALPPERVVLEILEDVVVDDTLVEAVAALVRGGYQVALDDFAFDERWRPLLELAHIVKIDVMSLGLERVSEQIEALAGFRVELLAEKVETAAEYEALRTLGFHYYQGYFFARPTVMSGTRPPANRLAVLKLLAVLQDSGTEMEEIGVLVAQDPSLSYRLLRFINSAAVGIPKRITTMQRAIIYIGLAPVKRWVTLMVLAGMSDKPSELIRLALTRARMTESICAHTGAGDPGVGFTAGLFSLLDAFMDRPLPELVADLPLSPELRDALIGGHGPAGGALRSVVAYERGHWEVLEREHGDVALGELAELYAEALEWSAAAAAAAH